MRFRRWTALFVLVALLVGPAACSKVSKESYDKVQTGMTLSEVEGILGKGTEKAGLGGAIGDLGGSARVVTWGDENKSITITFANDKVVLKAEKGL